MSMNLFNKFYKATLSGPCQVAKGAVLDFVTGSSLKIAGTAVDATAAELNRATDISARVVSTTATALSLTITQHSDRVVLVDTNSTVANTLTLPAATGSGAKFTVINNIAQTQGSIVVAANGTDIFKGACVIANTSTTVNAIFALTSATSDKVTWNRTTTGGAGPGDIIEAWDIAANTWAVQVKCGSVGAAATPFSAT